MSRRGRHERVRALTMVCRGVRPSLLSSRMTVTGGRLSPRAPDADPSAPLVTARTISRKWWIRRTTAMRALMLLRRGLRWSLRTEVESALAVLVGAREARWSSALIISSKLSRRAPPCCRTRWGACSNQRSTNRNASMRTSTARVVRALRVCTRMSGKKGASRMTGACSSRSRNSR